MKGRGMRLWEAMAGGLVALWALCMAGPALADPSPAVVAMRWQWLNPEINSFTFRDTDKVFESRPVPRSGPVWALERGPALAMPGDYQAFAERTFTNGLLVIHHGKIAFEDYRNRMAPETRHISFSMAKTITSMLLGIARGEGRIASFDDPAAKYVPIWPAPATTA